MKVYIARSNKIENLEFERAKKIVSKDLDVGMLSFLYHDKALKYDPDLLKSADLCVIITVDDQKRIGKGIRQQIRECKALHIPHLHLTIGEVGESLTHREYHHIKSVKITDHDEFDERHASLTLGDVVHPTMIRPLLRMAHDKKPKSSGTTAYPIV